MSSNTERRMDTAVEKSLHKKGFSSEDAIIHPIQTDANTTVVDATEAGQGQATVKIPLGAIAFVREVPSSKS